MEKKLVEYVNWSGSDVNDQCLVKTASGTLYFVKLSTDKVLMLLSGDDNDWICPLSYDQK